LINGETKINLKHAKNVGKWDLIFCMTVLWYPKCIPP